MTLTTNLSTQRISAHGAARRLISSFTRPANTTAYVAGDVINSTTGATVVGFTNAGVAGKIVGASIIMGETDTANLQLVVFDEEPTNFADNAALAIAAGDVAKIVGVFNFLDASKVNVGTNRELYRADVESLDYGYKSEDGKLYAHLVTRSAFTPLSAAVFAINLHVEANG